MLEHQLYKYLHDPSCKNRYLVLDYVEILRKKAVENLKNKHVGKDMGADQLWPEIKKICSQECNNLINKITIQEYFKLCILFEDIFEISNKLSNPILQVILLTHPYLDKKIIHEFSKDSENQISKINILAEKYQQQNVTKLAYSLSNKLNEALSHLISNENYKKPYHVLSYINQINSITQDSEEIKQLSSQYNYKGVIGNVIIGLTGVGAIAIGLKASYSKIKHGHADIFFREDYTKKLNITPLRHDLTV
ncbi:MAG: hypothetical protein EP298_11025 [Gammaproteobacteria bacterium]|nr:MAG: hypothetical protein EP298_11025 [Gammaproteobacteria bacterium]UTW43521.1 hypothetical protein KFE69_05365 [bacterium SCSIO 12844]